MSAPHNIEQLDLVHGGLPVTTLAQIFGLDTKDAQRRLVGKAMPVEDVKSKIVKYRLRDAAPHLIDVKFDVEAAIKKLPPSKIPPSLQDAFWKAQLSRQKFESNRGDLWATHRVIEIMATAFKTVRMQILMFVDTVQQREELSDPQRQLIEKLSDELLSGLQKSLVEEFELYAPPPDEHGAPIDAVEIASVRMEIDDVEAEDDYGLG
jgi:hypothetical protein